MGTTRRGEWTKVDGWTGKHGRVWCDPAGTLTFHIRKQIGGRRYDLSTGCTSLRSALAHLERFEKDPEGYRPAGDPGTEPIFLDNDRSKEFLRWSRFEKGNTPEWVAKQKKLLAWWMERLRGVNLRRATIRDHLHPALENTPGRRHRIEVVKAFYAWLRKEKHEINAHEDPTFGALPVPQADPAQRKKTKVIPREHYLLAREHLVGVYRDALDVLAGTGWHVTELVRFAGEKGEIEPLPKAMKVEYGAVAVLVCPMHKSGDMHRTAVGAEVLEAAKRLRARGWPADSVFPFYEAVTSACAAAKIPAFSPGRFRHSVATWAIEAGADPKAVSAFLGHKSVSTTMRFYATMATVPKVPTLA